MTFLEAWGIPLTVAGMVLATLVLAATARRYQEHLLTVGVVVRRLESTLLAVSAALQDLHGVPLSRELRVTLRSDILARYRKIRRLYRRYPQIGQKIAAAESALQAEGGAGGAVGPIENEQAFRRKVAALDVLIGVIARGDTLQPIPHDVRAIFRRELGERRAEVVSRYHLVESRRHENDGNLMRARAHLTTLKQALIQHGPPTGFVRELQGEARAALDALEQRQFASAV